VLVDAVGQFLGVARRRGPRLGGVGRRRRRGQGGATYDPSAQLGHRVASSVRSGAVGPGATAPVTRAAEFGMPSTCSRI